MVSNILELQWGVHILMQIVLVQYLFLTQSQSFSVHSCMGILFHNLIHNTSLYLLIHTNHTLRHIHLNPSFIQLHMRKGRYHNLQNYHTFQVHLRIYYQCFLLLFNYQIVFYLMMKDPQIRQIFQFQPYMMELIYHCHHPIHMNKDPQKHFNLQKSYTYFLFIFIL